MQKETIRERAEALGKVAALPVQVLDTNGRAELRCGGLCEYCKIFKRYMKPGESCEGLHALAGRRAMDLGESYIFTCHAGVYHIVMPLVSGSEFDGAVLLGPFMLGAMDSTLLQEDARRYQLPMDALFDMYDAAGSLKTLSTDEAGGALPHGALPVRRGGGKLAGGQARARAAAEPHRRIDPDLQGLSGGGLLLPAGKGARAWCVMCAPATWRRPRRCSTTFWATRCF
jgi:ligand-binding sensor protein